MITYLDKEILKIGAFTLLINVESIIQICGSLEAFDQELNFGGITNGKLYGVSFMSFTDEEESTLFDFFAKYNFVEQQDYIFIESGLFYGVKHQIDTSAYQEQSATLNIPWLSSILTQYGTFVWFIDTQKGTIGKQLQNQYLQNIAKNYPYFKILE